MNILRNVVAALFFAAASSSLTYGCYLIHPILGYLVGGVILVLWATAFWTGPRSPTTTMAESAIKISKDAINRSRTH